MHKLVPVQKKIARADGYNKEITHFRKPVSLLSAARFGRKKKDRLFTGSVEIIGSAIFSFSRSNQ